MYSLSLLHLLCYSVLNQQHVLFMKPQTQVSTHLNLFLHTSIHPVFANSKCQHHIFCRLKIPHRTCFWATTIEEVRCLFNMAQAIGVETVEWIAEAKKCCGLLRRSHGWNWNGKEHLDSDSFPLLEGQLLISEPVLKPNDSNALILHLHYSNQARAKASAVFLSPTHFSQPLVYPSTNYDANIDLANTICSLNVAE